MMKLNMLFIHIRNLKQTLDDGLVFKKLHRVIKLNQKYWLKPYIDMKIDLRKAAKDEFEKDFFKLINNADFGKSMENRNKKTHILVNKRVYLGFSILEMSKTVIGEFWCDYVKPKYHEKAILC